MVKWWFKDCFRAIYLLFMKFYGNRGYVFGGEGMGIV